MDGQLRHHRRGDRAGGLRSATEDADAAAEPGHEDRDGAVPAIAEQANVEVGAVTRELNADTTIAQTKASYGKLGVIDRQVDAKLREIAFPASMDGDVQRLLKASGALEDIFAALSTDRTRGEYDADRARLGKATEAFRAARDLVRKDLELPTFGITPLPNPQAE